MCVELKKQNITCLEKRIARLMKSHQIAAKRKRRFVVPTNFKHLQGGSRSKPIRWLPYFFLPTILREQLTPSMVGFMGVKL